MHSSLMCFQRPRPALKTHKAMNRIGPVATKWIETRHQWIQANANPTNTWRCHYGPEILGLEADPDNNIELLTLDHKLSRSRHPELRYDLDNLVPACAAHNHEKGSKSAEEYAAWLEAKLAA